MLLENLATYPFQKDTRYPAASAELGDSCVFEIIAAADPFYLGVSILAVLLFGVLSIRRRGSRELTSLKKENTRLKNMVAELMLERA